MLELKLRNDGDKFKKKTEGEKIRNTKKGKKLKFIKRAFLRNSKSQWNWKRELKRKIM